MIEKSKFFYCSFCIFFWVLATWAFVIQEIPGLGVLEGPIRFLIDFAVIPVGLMALNNKRDALIMVSFVLLSFTSTIFINGESLLTYLNGFREYIGLIFMAPIVRYILTCHRRDEFVAGFDRQIVIFLALQLIVVPFQAIKYGVGDHGGGTLGDGLSGTLSTVIYMATFYLVSRRWDPTDYLGSLYKARYYFILLIPTFLNETKISFIYLLIFFLLLFALKWTSVLKVVVAMPFVTMLLGVLAYFYLSVTHMDYDMFIEPEFYQAYLFGDDGDRLIEFSENYENGDYYELEDQWAVDLPRFFKIAHVPEMLEKTKGGMWFGAGNGQLKGGTMLDKTEFARKNEIWFRGTIPLLFDLLVQMGILGVIWFVINILTALKLKNNRAPMGLNNKVLMLSFIFLQLFYGTLFTYLIVDLFLYYITFRSTNLVEEDDPAPASVRIVS